jgi:hypothetical protein
LHLLNLVLHQTICFIQKFVQSVNISRSTWISLLSTDQSALASFGTAAVDLLAGAQAAAAARHFSFLFLRSFCLSVLMI